MPEEGQTIAGRDVFYMSHWRTGTELKELQSLPFRLKTEWAKGKIEEWYDYWNGNVVISFSGGLDSTVLLHIVRSIYPQVKAVFVDTGVEYPEIREFVKTMGNVTWLKPKKSFWIVIEQYGWPLVSKRISEYVEEVRNSKSEDLIRMRMTGVKKTGKFNRVSKISDKWKFLVYAPFNISDRCCYYLKIEPIKRFNKENGNPAHYIGMKAFDNEQRSLTWKQYGCNAFEKKRPSSWPLGIWSQSDVLQYLNLHKVPYCKSIYGKIKKEYNGNFTNDGYERTGCMYCGFGLHMPCRQEKENHLQMLAKTHPKHYDFVIRKKRMGEVLDYAKLPYKPRKQIGFFVDRKPK